MLYKPTQRISYLVLATCAFLGTIYFWSEGDISSIPRHHLFTSPFPNSLPGAGNATLGFGAIYVLTEDTTTWRVQGLPQAAKLAGLKLQIPMSKQPSDDEVRKHVGGEPSEGYGHARALLNHVALLEQVTASPYGTALILEDDADFGINIREQMEVLSRAFWDHAKIPLKARVTGDEALHPYRDNTDWDVLWPGHFGMTFIEGTEVFQYKDPHAVPWNRLKSQFNNYYEQMASISKPESPESQQLIFKVAPLATFAYAITRPHAAKLAEKLKKDKAHKFDNEVHIDCVGGFHRCVAPVPQLFHHHQVVGEKASSSERLQEEVVQDMAWYRTIHRYTYNIEWSARCNATKLGEKIGDKWQCLPEKDDPMM